MNIIKVVKNSQKHKLILSRLYEMTVKYLFKFLLLCIVLRMYLYKKIIKKEKCHTLLSISTWLLAFERKSREPQKQNACNKNKNIEEALLRYIYIHIYLKFYKYEK